MHGSKALVADGWDLLAHEDVAGKVEAGLCREPGQREQEEQHGEHEPDAIAIGTTDEGDAVATHCCDGQPEREQDAERRQRVDPARVEVVLVDDARNGRDRAECDRQPDEQPRPAGGRRQSDRHERERVVEQDERTAEAGSEVARVVDVVERLGRQARVGDERRGRLEPEQAPDGERLG